MLMITRRILLVMLTLNWVAAAIFVLFGAMLVIAPDYMTGEFREDFGGDADAVRHALIAMMIIGLTAVPPVHIIFGRIIAMIDTVRSGQPFASANADRLRHVAWGMLVLQLIDLAFGWSAMRLSEATGELVAWQFSVTGWLAVLLLFVLARVFQQGAAMQDEIEGTV